MTTPVSYKRHIVSTDFENIETVFSQLSTPVTLTLSSGTTYIIHVSTHADYDVIFRVGGTDGDAEFPVKTKTFEYKHGTNDLYIKTPAEGCDFSILEKE